MVKCCVIKKAKLLMIVIKARTFEEWKAILDYFYDKDYAWQYRQNKYNEIFFKRGRQLIFEDDKSIEWATRNTFNAMTFEQFTAE